jgi:hypothetical protein
MALLLSTPHLTVATAPDTRLVRYVRTSVPYVSVFEFELLHERVAALFDQLGRRQHVLLVDTREAVMNNDPAFEKASNRARPSLVRDFRRIAVLVKTAVGALQVGRHIREGGIDSTVFNDEKAALAFLLSSAPGLDADHSPTSSVRTPRSNRSSNPGKPPKR